MTILILLKQTAYVSRNWQGLPLLYQCYIRNYRWKMESSYSISFDERPLRYNELRKKMEGATEYPGRGWRFFNVL